MPRQTLRITFFSLFLLLVLGTSVFANEEIKGLITANAGRPLADRIEAYSHFLIGKPYVVEALGEGDDGKYDRDPLYRFDGFDCTTYVETVMALASARDFDAFQDLILRIRYKDGAISYPTRNHFTEVDWIPNNVASGFLADVNGAVAGEYPVEYAETVINKRGWFEHLPMHQINVPGLSDQERAGLWLDLRAEGAAFGSVPVSNPYLSLRMLIPDGEPNRAMLARIPSGTIMNVIRPDWNPGSGGGTHLNVSHQAVLVRRNGQLLMRHASSRNKSVIEVPLVDELRGYLSSATIKGISLYSVL